MKLLDSNLQNLPYSSFCCLVLTRKTRETSAGMQAVKHCCYTRFLLYHLGVEEDTMSHYDAVGIPAAYSHPFRDYYLICVMHKSSCIGANRATAPRHVVIAAAVPSFTAMGSE